jgi:hypothetical protein
MATCIASSGALAAKPSSALAWRRTTAGKKKISTRAVGTVTTRGRGGCVCVRASAASERPDDQRVVITGAGVVSTAGNDRDTFFDTLLAGKSGVIDLTEWKPGVFDDLPTTIGAPIQNLDYGTDLTAKEARRMDRVHQYAVCAGKRALRDAGLWGADLDGVDKTRVRLALFTALLLCVKTPMDDSQHVPCNQPDTRE